MTRITAGGSDPDLHTSGLQLVKWSEIVFIKSWRNNLRLFYRLLGRRLSTNAEIFGKE
jgi:hypothetical protein